MSDTSDRHRGDISASEGVCGPCPACPIQSDLQALQGLRERLNTRNAFRCAHGLPLLQPDVILSATETAMRKARYQQYRQQFRRKLPAHPTQTGMIPAMIHMRAEGHRIDPLIQASLCPCCREHHSPTS